MRVLDTEPDRKVPLWRRLPPVVWVVLALLLLLHGPRGAFWAVLHQAWGMVATLLGGDEVVIGVLGQTAPLALATAVVTFLYCREWITFESMWSLMATAGILIGGASAGVHLRALLQRVAPPGAVEHADANAAKGDFAVQSLILRTRLHGGRLPASEAVRVLTDHRYVSELGAAGVLPNPIPRVALLPEGTNALGIVGRGVNQLLGYLVFYRPRMFLAALIAGGYLGWASHRRLEDASDRAIDWRHERESRRAA
ncbi:hypothetical protein KOR34_45060 [Posidoniimonas corsicana]|uniref:Uncharacterized protein n=1 Tax=Posidoniimonas corsicana TaxID=1938618 RepID=A0A5C5UY08_9BACT|nr:hypothetical protein [Posidoniimonas corsicana]TWT31131.1 hypothetical protein KOR34_45060 [Posidoniimonas corsicana]